jgi:hypothetical protein
MGRPLAEPSDDPKINERRRKAREQARERSSTAKQLKVKGIGARESLDRKSTVMKEKDCDDQLTIVKKELKRKQAQIKFLAENINKVEESSSKVKGSSGSVIVDKNIVEVLAEKVDDMVGEDIDAVDTMSKMMKRVLAKKQIENMKKENAGRMINMALKGKIANKKILEAEKQRTLDILLKPLVIPKTKSKVPDNMATKIQNAIRAKNARLALKGKKFIKSNESKYMKKLDDENKAKKEGKKVITEEERKRRDATFGTGFN